MGFHAVERPTWAEMMGTKAVIVNNKESDADWIFALLTLLEAFQQAVGS